MEVDTIFVWFWVIRDYSFFFLLYLSFCLFFSSTFLAVIYSFEMLFFFCSTFFERHDVVSGTSCSCFAAQTTKSVVHDFLSSLKKESFFRLKMHQWRLSHREMNFPVFFVSWNHGVTFDDKDAKVCVKNLFSVMTLPSFTSHLSSKRTFFQNTNTVTKKRIITPSLFPDKGR